jgi:hypothetical protein
MSVSTIVEQDPQGPTGIQETIQEKTKMRSENVTVKEKREIQALNMRSFHRA